MPISMDDVEIFARTLYGEAEPNNHTDLNAIAAVIMNRVIYPNWPDDVGDVCLQPLQFSCWNDPANKARLMRARDKWYGVCLATATRAIQGNLPDTTNLSTHYYETSVKKPRWAKNKTPVLEVPHKTGTAHVFYNNIDTPAPTNAREALDQERPLSTTGAHRGAQVTTAGVSLSAASEAVTDLQDQVGPMVYYLDVAKYLFLVLAIAGVAITLYSLISDRKKGLR